MRGVEHLLTREAYTYISRGRNIALRNFIVPLVARRPSRDILINDGDDRRHEEQTREVFYREAWPSGI